MTATSRRGRRSLLSRTALVLAVGVVAAGCTAQPGTAATVDRARISVGDVDVAAREWSEATGQPLPPAQVADLLVQAKILGPLAAEAGFVYSDQEVERMLAQVAEGQGTDMPDEPAPSTIDLVRLALQQADLGNSPQSEQLFADFRESLEEADIRINPRYGQPDAATGQLVPIEHPWLHAEPAEEPAPEELAGE